MIKTIKEMQAALKNVGRTENDEDKLAEYLRVQETGLPVREVNEWTGVVTVFAGIVEMFAKWPAASVDGFEMNDGCWDVMISD